MFALGEIGLLPDQFYEMEIEDFVLKSEGFFDYKIWFERSLRRLGQVIQAPHVDKSAPSMIQQWPIAKDDEMAEIRKRAMKRSAADQILAMKKIIDAAKKPINES